jgi:hypothetical protein
MSTRPGSVFQFTIWQHSSLLDEVARPDHLFITDGLSSNDLINYANAIRRPGNDPAHPPRKHFLDSG